MGFSAGTRSVTAGGAPPLGGRDGPVEHIPRSNRARNQFVGFCSLKATFRFAFTEALLPRRDWSSDFFAQ
jgi:hypothetical protein